MVIMLLSYYSILLVEFYMRFPLNFGGHTVLI